MRLATISRSLHFSATHCAWPAIYDPNTPDDDRFEYYDPIIVQICDMNKGLLTHFLSLLLQCVILSKALLLNFQGMDKVSVS